MAIEQQQKMKTNNKMMNQIADRRVCWPVKWMKTLREVFKLRFPYPISALPDLLLSAASKNYTCSMTPMHSFSSGLLEYRLKLILC